MSQNLSWGSARNSLSGFLHEVYTGLDRGELFVAHQPVVDVRRGRSTASRRWCAGPTRATGCSVPTRSCRFWRAWVICRRSAGSCSVTRAAALRRGLRSAAPTRVSASTCRSAYSASRASCTTSTRPWRTAGWTRGAWWSRSPRPGSVPDVLAAQAACRHLRARSIAIALDDVGTGEYDVARVALLDVDELKLDRSMVRALPGDTHQLAIVGQVLDAAATAGLQVTVEGVETLDQLRAVRSVGGRLVQGFLFGRPRVLDGAEHVRVLDRRCRELLDTQPAPRRPVAAASVAPALV